MRTAAGWALVLVAACGGGGGSRSAPGGPPVPRIVVERRDDDGKATWYLRVRFPYRAPAGAGRGPDEVQLHVRAACQVGAVRLVDDSPEFPASGLRDPRVPKGTIESTPFLLGELPAKPSLCELVISEQRGFRDPPRTLVEVCAKPDTPPTPGRCAPNPVDGPGTGGGWSVPSLEVEHVDADPDAVYLGGEQLVLRYTVQAHRDMTPNTWVNVAIQCQGGFPDDVSHTEAGALRSGEAFHAGQIKLNGRVPSADTPCEVTFTSTQRDEEPREVIERFCYRDRQTTRGACL